MPSGYTSKLYEGKDQSFPEFALTCARAFGALIEMRDEPFDATIPDVIEPSHYHLDQLKATEREISRFITLSDEEIDAMIESDYEHALAVHNESVASRRALRNRYRAMLRKVQAWVPPTEDHARFKEFMIEQLEESIRFDCSSIKGLRPKRLTRETFIQKRVERARWNLAYHRTHYAEDVERAAERTAWIQSLRASLAPAQPAK